MSVGVVHDAQGALKPHSATKRAVWEEFNDRRGGHRQIFRNFYSVLNGFQRNLVEGRPNAWKCRAGARYLYVSQNGLVGWCSQHPSVPGIRIERYGPDEVERELTTIKDCAAYCTVGCVHRVSTLDWWLDPFRRRRPVAALPGREGRDENGRVGDAGTLAGHLRGIARDQ